MAAGSGDHLYGDWSRTNVKVKGITITIETNQSEAKMDKQLRKAGFVPEKK